MGRGVSKERKSRNVDNKPSISRAELVRRINLYLLDGLGYMSALNLILKDFYVSVPTFQKYWRFEKDEFEERQRKEMEELERQYRERNRELFDLAVINKSSHARKLWETILRLEKEADELKMVRIGTFTGEDGTEVVITQANVTQVKRTLVLIYKEIRETRKLIGEWYGFNMSSDPDKPDRNEEAKNKPDISSIPEDMIYSIADYLQGNVN